MSHNVTLLEDEDYDLKDGNAPEYDFADLKNVTKQDHQLHPQAIAVTEVSLSQSLLNQADIIAQEMNVSINQLFELALEEFFRRHRGRKLFESYNEAYKDGLDEEEQELLHLMRPLQCKVVEGEW